MNKHGDYSQRLDGSSHYVLLLYPRNLPGPLCVQCPGSQAVQAGVKVRCQAWASESGERGGGIALHTAENSINMEVKAEQYEGQTSSVQKSVNCPKISRAWP